MSNQHLELAINELSARVTQQDIKIAELQKQLTNMQASRKLENAMMNEIQNAMLASDQAFCSSLSKL
ncbi:MAG: hypothetical protein PV362_16580 [Providencia heimbachae]|nr:hypothetical protein [Providencia heimbachae]